MIHAPIKTKFGRLFPEEGWDNPKRHISVLVKGGKIFAYGESSLGGKPRCAAYRGRSCHSEMSVLKLIKTELGNKRKVRKYTLWNVRWDRNGDLANSKPCLHCQQVLLQVGIRKVVYSTKEGKFNKRRLDRLHCELSSGFKY